MTNEVSINLSTKMPDEYKWISMVDRLSNGDFTKHDMIYKKNWRETLYLLSFYAEKDKIERMKNMATKNI